MRNHLFRFLLFLLFLFTLLTGKQSIAQTVTIGTVAPGPYGAGSDITVPVKLGGVFKKGSKFELFLSDASGSFASPVSIGLFEGHFATYVNGKIPAATTPGTGYKLMIIPDGPGGAGTPVVYGNTIEIKPQTGPRVLIAASPSKTIVEDKILGNCSYSSNGNQLGIENRSSSGATVSASLISDCNIAELPAEVTFNSNSASLILSLGYYTLRVKAVQNGIISVKSYQILNSTNNLGLNGEGSNTVCVGGTARFFVVTPDKLITNYPGTIYKVSWGDGGIDAFTQSELLASGGYVTHRFDIGSCGQPPVGDPAVYNAFKVNITADASFCASAWPPYTSYAWVFSGPKAEFDVPPLGACINGPVTFNNNSVEGLAPGANGNICTNETEYNWFVKKESETTFVWRSFSRNLSYSFSEPGVYNVKLVATNNACEASEITHNVCIEEPVIPGFTIAQSSPCVTAVPVTLQTANATSESGLCNISYTWQVVDAVSNVVVTNGISFLPNNTVREPSVSVSIPGEYKLKLEATNSCGSFDVAVPFTVAGPLAVSLPGEKKYCRQPGEVIDFGTNPFHKPVYTGFGSNKIYKWEVSGGAYSFMASSSDGSPFPVIRFDEQAVYTVKVTFTNECIATPQVASQVINFYPNIIREAGPSDVICDNVPGVSNTSYQLNANTPGQFETGKWTLEPASSGVNPVFVNDQDPHTMLNNLLPGTYLFKWTVSNTECTESDTVRLTVYAKPAGGIITGNTHVCTGGNGTLQLNAYAGKIAEWESSPDGNTWSPVAGTEGVFSCSYTNLQQKTWYRVKIASGGASRGCTAEVYSTVFTVEPDPPAAGGSASAGAQLSFCEGLPNSRTITLTGQVGQVSEWQQSADGIVWIGIPNSSGSSYTYPDLNATTSFRALVKSGECTAAAYSLAVTITVIPLPRQVSAGTNGIFCIAADSFQLHGSEPSPGTTGEWKQTSGPAVVFAEKHTYNTMISGVQKGKRYAFEWSVSNGSCDPVKSAVTIDVLNDIVNEIKADKTVICPGEPLALSSNVLTGGEVPGITLPVYAFQWEYLDAGNHWASLGANTGNENIVLYPAATISLRRRVASSSSCEAESNIIQIIVNPATPQANAGADQEICNANSASLNADAASGFTGTWEDTASGSTLVFSDVHAHDAVVQNLEPGQEYRLKWTIGGISPCPSTSDIVVIKVNKPAQGGTTAGSVSTVCTGSNSGTITLTGHLGNVIRWESSSDNWVSKSVLLSPGTSYLFTGLIATTKFRAVVKNGSCPEVESTSVEVKVLPDVTSANAGPDQHLCAATGFSLAANAPANGTGSWSQLSGGAAHIDYPSDPTTSVSGLTAGTYKFRWTISNNICDPSVSDVIIYNYPELINHVSGATTICSGQTVSISGQLPAGGDGTYQYLWQTSTDAISWTDLSLQTGQDFSQALTSPAYIRRRVISGPCQNESNTVYIEVKPPISNNNIGAQLAEVCIGQHSPLLTGSLPAGADGGFLYQWQQRSGVLAWANISGASSADYAPPVLSITTSFRRVVSTALCNGAQKNISNTITVVVNPLAKAEFSASKQKSCTPFDLATVITPVLHPDRNGSYEWFANDLSLGTGESFPGYTIGSDGEKVRIKLLADSKFGCGTDTISMVFETVKNVTASFTKDQVRGCGPLTVNFTNTSVPQSGPDYLWDFGNGQTSALAQPGAVVFAPHPLNRDTTYIITLKAYTDCQSTIYTDSVLVRPKPVPIFSPDVTNGCSPLTINIKNQSRGIPNTYTWDFGDGQTLVSNDNRDLSHTYYTAVTDTVTIKLIAENECGRDSSSYNIVVYPNTITADLVVNGDKKFGCIPFEVKFDNNSIGANKFNWDFADGGTLITGSAPETVSHTFTVPGIYHVKLLATNGCSQGTDEEIITVYPNPDAVFAPEKPVYCVTDSVAFINSSDANCSFRWDFNDGGFSDLPAPKHVFNNPGTYNVKLTVLRSYPDGSICSNSSMHPVEILALPVAIFSSNAAQLNCVPFNLNVAATPANAANVEWDFGDPPSGDNIATGFTASHLFTEPGIYTVRATAYNFTGCAASYIQYVKVTERVRAAFETSDSLLCGPAAAITFTNRSVYQGQEAVTWRWLINNAQVSTLKDLQYSFHTPAGAVLPYVYEVKLIARSTLGCPDTVSRVIRFNPLPKAGFELAESIACPPYRPVITNKSSFADQFFWYLNGELVSTAREPAGILLDQPGITYELKLVTANQYGCRRDSMLRNVATYARPSAAFTLNDSVSCNGKLDLSAENRSHDATSYTWDFGDNSAQLHTLNASHLYGEPGVYQLRLIAANTFCRDTLTRVIRIAAVPQAAFTADITKACTQAVVSFQNLSVNTQTYLWDFGDASYSSSKNPVHTFSYTKSPFNVKLIAYGEFGCADTTIITKCVEITRPPVADFYVLPDTLIKIPEFTFSFKNSSTVGPVKYRWFFGDGKLSDLKDPEHTYTDTGVYKVSLIAENAEGCTDTISRQVRIGGVPGYLFVPSGFEPASLKADLRTFLPKGSGIAKYELKIFNKWGNLIWQTNLLDNNGSPLEGWDGTMNGSPAPQGVYFWEISARFIEGDEWKGMKYERGQRKTVGPIHLIR